MSDRIHVSASPATSSACVSDLALDELVAGRPIRRHEQEHVDACPRCAGRRALFADAVVVADAAVSRLLAAARTNVANQTRVTPPRRSWWARPAMAIGGALVAAAVLIVVLRRDPASESKIETDGIRIKGASARWFVQRDGRVSAAASGDVFRAGDALRCAITIGESRQLLLVGVDRGADHLAVYYPPDATSSVLMAAGVEMPLPNSLVLDDAPGPEYFVVLLSPTPFSVDDVKRQLANARADGVQPEAAIARLIPGGTQLLFTVRKE